MKEENQRIGKFTLPIFKLATMPAAQFREIMGMCVILRAESRHWDGSVEYEALSPYFDIVPEGVIPPTYEWTNQYGKWTAHRTDMFYQSDVDKMIQKAVKAVPAKVIIKQRGRGWH